MKETLRGELTRRFPQVRFSFEPADIVSEVMSFGSTTPIEIAARGANLQENRAYLLKVQQELAALPYLRDIQFAQSLDYPTVDVRVDRERAGLSGASVADVARSVVAATSSTRFVVPNYWPDPKTGIGYQVQLEIPQPWLTSVDDLGAIPVSDGVGSPLLLRDIAQIHPGHDARPVRPVQHETRVVPDGEYLRRGSGPGLARDSSHLDQAGKSRRQAGQRDGGRPRADSPLASNPGRSDQRLDPGPDRDRPVADGQLPVLAAGAGDGRPPLRRCWRASS